MDDGEFVIPLTVFENKDDNRPARHELAWHAFAERLARYDERPTKDGKAWSPVTYVPGTTRGKANVETVHALVLDVDHSTLPLDLLESYEYLAHTTFQHTPEAPRWRVVLPLLVSIKGADWPAFWLRANAYFGGCVDPATKDSSRIFYLPSCPPGGLHEVRQQHGRLLDMDELPEVPVYTPSPRKAKRSVFKQGLAEWAQRFSVVKTAELANMPRDSGRNDACNRLAHTLGGLVAEPAHDLQAEWVVDTLLDACHQNGLIRDDGEGSVRSTIRSGLESGLMRAWSPADLDPPTPVRARHTAETHVSGSRLKVVRMSEVKSEAVDWLWRNRLARGKATLLMGDPGLGKSLISHWLAAQVSIGAEWPDGSGRCDQGSAILFTIEDGLADTVSPRLEAAGADKDRVHAVHGVVDVASSLDERMFGLDEDVEYLEDLIVRERAQLVVMDPVTAYLGANINAHKDTDVRRVLAPLQMMAERTGVACLLLMHLTKGSGVSALYRATGSIAFPAVCRIVLGVAPDPNDSEGKRRLLLPIKMNVAPEATGIGYHIETTRQQILARVDERDQPPILVWDNEPVLVDATSAMDRSGTTQEMGMLAQVKRAIEQIWEQLDGGTEMLSRDVEGQLKQAGLSTAPATLSRARTELGITFRKDASKHGPWYWVFPRVRATGKYETRETREPRGSQDSQGSQVSQESSRTREAPADFKNSPRVREEMRYCPTCTRNLTEEAYTQHLPCTKEELCPVHHKLFSLHDCDQL